MSDASSTPSVDPSITTLLARQAKKERLDRAAAELVEALTAHSIDCLLLKGPATGRVLYPGEHRFYGDIDLLVAPVDHEAASAVATHLGYDRHEPTGAYQRWLRRQLEGKDRVFTRQSDGVMLELHRSFHLLDHRADLFGALREHRDSMHLHGVAVSVPNAAAVGFLALLHAKAAALPGNRLSRLSSDVARAVEQIDTDSWIEAAEIARTLGAGPACVASLRELGGVAGQAIADTAFAHVRPDRWLVAHLRTGSVVALKIIDFRSKTNRARFVWLATHLLPFLGPDYTETERAVSAQWRGRRWWAVRDLRLALRVALSRRG